MGRVRLLLACVLLSMLALGGCGDDAATESSVQSASVSTEEDAASDVPNTWVSMDGLVVAVEQTQTVTVFMSNDSSSAVEVADFLGVRVTDASGALVFDTHDSAPWYPTVYITLEPGQTRSRSFPFVVTRVGPHTVAGYFWDGTETAGLDFTATSTR
ncbi:MAG: hypothetical protein PF636_08750 [Actinomycetota bacterium]|jgi:hypothetical protein|nr:hypothetical protein [Actinomycetota bacterium]